MSDDPLFNSPFQQPNQPVEIEALNPRVYFRQPAIGNVYELKLAITEDLWRGCKDIPRDAVVKGILWWEPSGYVAHSPIPEAEKGPWGDFWYNMFRKGFQFAEQTMEALEVDTADRVHDKLHEVFNVQSLTHLAPDVFMKWARDNEIWYLVLMAEQVLKQDTMDPKTQLKRALGREQQEQQP